MGSRVKVVQAGQEKIQQKYISNYIIYYVATSKYLFDIDYTLKSENNYTEK